MQEASQKTSQGTLEAVTLLRLHRCTVCSVLFATEIVVLAKPAGEDTIHCPAGHCFRPAPLDQQPLEVRLQQAQFQIQQLRSAVEKYGDRLLPQKELRRRANLVAERAETGEFGKPICCYCGNSKKSRASLRNHIYRQHLEDLKHEPAEKFE